MIAIAGSKGGCGKTTTALGLAKALERAGNRTIAVDTDRQLPNLHTVARVDREPTVDRSPQSESLVDVAQPVAEHSNARVLPAPIESGSATMRAQLRELSTEAADIVLDCPSGAGPDLADPLAAAHVAVVVTTATDESLTAAAKTIAIARRLETPVAGTVLSGAKTVPDRYDERIDAPVLATVPPVDDPLDSSSARDAYDALADALVSEGYLSQESSERDRPTGRLATGIESLDRTLEGGIAPGSLVALSAAAASQSELLLYELTSARPTVYLTTERSVDAVARALESTCATVGDPSLKSIGDETPLEDVGRFLADLPDGSNLIVDTMDVLERAETTAYVEFLGELADRLESTGSVGYLHCLKGIAEPENRTRTEHAADVVLDLATDRSSPDHTLAVPKRRRGPQPATAISLELTDGVEVDTSRDIA
ncbi:DUF7125 family protein [Halostagnicola kamekurae]|uniref:MinD-like ATPase involved in chromosome partitioning or flagellar assembly n=1 Tax=Halostagnicola kamekurae TaxID=619731 RepID=A0A1I6QUH3_9EURY|nr:P-loop NTPase [Halostagnicola kamekurae]SFS56081.1 MinD-like ATPase involved in chromosome partitioning or flagellar assembly [Halostagnicola kamekurae]